MYELCFIYCLLQLTYFNSLLPSCIHRVPSVGSAERAVGCSNRFIEGVSLYRRSELLLLVDVKILVELHSQVESVMYVVLNK
jgi:hypothetical protein